MKKIILTILVSISAFSYGQRKYAAERYFNELAYKKSAELYEKIYEKGDESFEVLSRLGDCYYYNVLPEKAEIWYEKLMNTSQGASSQEYIFKYAQVLKSNGKNEASDLWLNKLPKNDNRVKALASNKDYFANYTNQDKIYMNIHNLSINSSYSDFGGFVFNDELYFSSTKPLDTKIDNKLYKWNNQPYLNLYKGALYLNQDIKVIDVKYVDRLKEVGTRYHESNAIITKDGNTMYFTRDNYNGKKLRKDKNQVSHLKIYRVTRKKDGKWGQLEELPFNSDLYSCGHPALSPDEKTLYFVSDKKGGFGATDIYKVAINGNEFGKVKNLGNTINTQGREMFPFIGENNVLYFSSNGHLGLGALDVFESKLENNIYTSPKNLKAPINGPLDDFAFVINKDLNKGFFSSNRKGGKGDDDIYSFNVFKCKESISGVITDLKTGEPIKNAEVKVLDSKGLMLFEQLTDENGAYSFAKLNCENEFAITASKIDYRSAKKNTKTLDINEKNIVVDLQLEPLIVDDQIVLRPIYFDFDLYNIREDAEYELEHIVDVMRNHPDMIIKIESHTDSRGTKAYNERLSTNRAKSTRDYIVSRGIAANRIQSAKGFGEYQLLNHCNDANQKKCTKEEHQLNRRSYFYIVSDTKNVKVINQK
ncbi:MAG: OmpA family protein [Tenacibaculum sp.]